MTSEPKHWRLTLEVEDGWPGEYPPPLPDVLEDALQERLGESIHFRPSALDDGTMRRQYRFQADRTLAGAELSSALVETLQDRTSHLPNAVRIAVHLRSTEGDEVQAQAVHMPP